MNTTTNTTQSAKQSGWAIVTHWELQGKLSNKVFVLANLGVALAILLAGFLVGLAGPDTEATKILATSETQKIAQQIAQTSEKQGLKLEVVEVESPDEGRQRIRDKNGEMLILKEQGGVKFVTKNVGGAAKIRPVAAAVVKNIAVQTNANTLGVSVDDLNKGAVATFEAMETDEEAKDRGINNMVSMLFIILFYMASLLGGLQLANAVVAEKTSRVAEIIASAIPLNQLLIGKVISNTIIAFGQLALVLAASLGAAHLADVPLALPQLQGALIWYLAFFLVGFVWLSSLWAMAGCLAGRSEDVQHTSLPVTMVVVGMYLAATMMTDGVKNLVFSILPPTSAIMMPARLVRGDAAWWEPVIALILLAATAALCLWAAGRIYGRSLLQGNEKLSFAKAWKLEH